MDLDIDFVLVSGFFAPLPGAEGIDRDGMTRVVSGVGGEGGEQLGWLRASITSLSRPKGVLREFSEMNERRRTKPSMKQFVCEDAESPEINREAMSTPENDLW